MKKIIFLLLSFLFFYNAYGQQPYFFSQYFKAAPAFNPAFTGVDNFLDIKLMHRTQWGGFDGSPSTQYLGVYRGLKKVQEISIKELSLRISNPEVYDSLFATTARKFRGKTKHGVGGFVSLDAFGPYSQLKGNLNYAFHLELENNANIAFGISLGLTNNRLDLSEINLADPDIDEFYQFLIAQGGSSTSLTVTPGILFYSPRFYFGYSAGNVGDFSIQDSGLDDNISSMIHYIGSGYQFPLAEKINLQTSAFYYYMNKSANNLDVNVKVDFNHRGYAGFSYRKSNDIVAMAGFTIQNKFQLGYSYDTKISGRNDLVNNSHELSLGLLLFNTDVNAPYTW